VADRNRERSRGGARDSKIEEDIQCKQWRRDCKRQRKSGKRKGDKYSRGFECSPEKALRSYLDKSITPHRMQQRLSSKSNYTSR